MKKGIHPTMEKCSVTCACGATFDTLSNKNNIQVEICSECHPVYKGKQGFMHKKAGSVEKFNQKYNLN